MALAVTVGALVDARPAPRADPESVRAGGTSVAAARGPALVCSAGAVTLTGGAETDGATSELTAAGLTPAGLTPAGLTPAGLTAAGLTAEGSTTETGGNTRTDGEPGLPGTPRCEPDPLAGVMPGFVELRPEPVTAPAAAGAAGVLPETPDGRVGPDRAARGPAGALSADPAEVPGADLDDSVAGFVPVSADATPSIRAKHAPTPMATAPSLPTNAGRREFTRPRKDGEPIRSPLRSLAMGRVPWVLMVPGGSA